MSDTSPPNPETQSQTTPDADLRFADLGLAPDLLKGLDSIGFEKCTPIQAQTLPSTLQGKDVAGQAQTGTGKTAAFLIATIQKLLSTEARPERKAWDPRALIIAPTRELAIQIHKDFQDLGKSVDLKAVLVYGGTGIVTQREELQKGVDILIGTPGRVIDYFKQRVFSLKTLDVMVLDEADRMFDLGFIQDIRYLYSNMPPPGERLTLMFSATFSQRVLELAYEHMHDPKFMRIKTESVTAENIEQKIYFPSKEQKKPLLVHHLNQLNDNARVLVFVNTKHEGEHLGATLRANGFHAQVFSGDVRQSRRQSMLADFRSGKLPIMIATDVAARGLHVPDVTHVFNYDLPNNREDYVHRIGRTARAGASGHALSFGCDEYVMVLPEIEDYIGYKIPVQQELPELPEITIPEKARRKDKRSGRDGRGGRSERRGQEKRGQGSRGQGSRGPDKRNTDSRSSPYADRDQARPGSDDDNWRSDEHDDNDKEQQAAFHAERQELLRREKYQALEHKMRLRNRLPRKAPVEDSTAKKRSRFSTPPLKERDPDQSAL
ncbi:MAG: DEAD/DEAH box helicase [Gammaproteobacteria bacterium]|nr:DEAD/DEAH box helicase [Gammaproteobacteria bacterium]NNC97486.1 DEAD/DEAH box helicase [Gammaproteobacteria bacterium]NNM13598.1 DEAD/DEAH box helicase [Gammaproteobacteria bacterium]